MRPTRFGIAALLRLTFVAGLIATGLHLSALPTMGWGLGDPAEQARFALALIFVAASTGFLAGDPAGHRFGVPAPGLIGVMPPIRTSRVEGSATPAKDLGKERDLA